MLQNPFTPSFGQIPMYIAGRSQIISDIERSWDSLKPDPEWTSIFVGIRGSGKTSLLSYFAKECFTHSWISVNVSCIPGIQEDILQQTLKASDEYIPKEKSFYLKGMSFGQFFGIEWEKTESRAKNWRIRMTEILDALEKAGVGLMITVDEVTPKLDEMVQIASVYQLLLRENKRIILLMAGLPSEVSSLLNNESVSFLRRATRYTLGSIEDYEIREAFRNTVYSSEGSISDKALDLAVRSIDGFPYMMQLVGYRSWQQSGGSGKIDTQNVKKGIELANEDFRSRVLDATFMELSDADIAFVRAMLDDDEVSEISDIEKRMNKSSGYVSRYRARLIERGIIEPRGRGRVAFTLPGFKEYLSEKV